MPVVNLDVVAPEAVSVSKPSGETWTLAPDVPAAVMIRVLLLGELMAENPMEDLPAFAEAQGLSLHEALLEWERREVEKQAKIEAETLRIFGGIWRWTFSDAPDEWLKITFSHRERYAVVDAFFAMRSGRSATAPNESASSSPATASAPTVPATNKVEQRAKATGSRKTRSATR